MSRWTFVCHTISQEDEEGVGADIEKDASCTLVLYGSYTEMKLTAPNLGKMVNDYAAQSVVLSTKRFFHQKIGLRCDGERGMVHVRDYIENQLPAGMVAIEKTPVHSSQSNPVEARINSVNGQIRAPKLDLEQRFGAIPSHKHPIFKLMIRHSGWLLSRYCPTNSGDTPYQLCNGVAHGKEILPFGETVCAKIPRPKHRFAKGKSLGKADTVAEKGLSVGRTEDSDEHIVMLANGKGVITTRTVKRIMPSQRHPKEALKRVRVVPWRTRADKYDVVYRRPRASEAKVQLPVARPVVETDVLERKPMPPRVVNLIHPRFFDCENESEAQSPKTFPGGPPTSSASSSSGSSIARMEADVGMTVAPVIMQIVEGEKDTKWVEVLWVEKPHAVDFEKHKDESDAGMDLQLRGIEENGVYEVIEKAEADLAKVIDTRVAYDWGWSAMQQKRVIKKRLVGRQYKLLDPERGDIFSPGITASTSRIIDVIVLKRADFDIEMSTFFVDATGAFWQAEQVEEVYVHPPGRWKERNPDAADKLWKLKRQFPGQRVVGKAWTEHFADALEELKCKRCESNPQLYYNEEMKVGMEVHMDDFHGFGNKNDVGVFVEKLVKVIKAKGGEFILWQKEYFYVKRSRVKMIEEHRVPARRAVQVKPNEKYFDNIINLFRLENAKEVPTPSTHDVGKNMIQNDEQLIGLLIRIYRSGMAEQYAAATVVEEWMNLWHVLQFFRFHSETNSCSGLCSCTRNN